MKCLGPLGLTICLLIAACGGGGGGNNGNGGAGGGTPGRSTAAQLVATLGRPAQLQVGLGAGNSLSEIQSQALQIDILDRYLPHSTNASWLFNYGVGATPGAYIDIVVNQADQLGAVPMFTLYQFAYRGENDPGLLSDRALMQEIWDNVRVLFDRLAAYDKPALVHVEPDFWGFSYAFSPGNDPARQFAHVKLAADCSQLPDTVVGIAQCMLKIRDARAPKVLVGFPPSDFGFGTQNVIRYMNQLGADLADFTVMQTLDRDAGCFEASGPGCSRAVSNPYWGPAQFDAHFTEAREYHEGIGGLPLLWWQTPMGVPSVVPGGSARQWRDNRVDNFLSDPQRLIDAGGAGVVFSAGADGQTTINSDGGHFQSRLSRYRASPAELR